MEAKYWFIVRQSVFVWIKGTVCYFYDSNTFMGQKIYFEDVYTEVFVKRLADVENLYSLPLVQSELENCCIGNLVASLVNLKMADLILQDNMRKKPIQLPPLLNLQADIRRIKEGNITDLSIGEGVLNNLQSVCIDFDTNIDLSFFDKLSTLLACLERRGFYEIIIRGYSSSLKNCNTFWEQLDDISGIKRIYLDLELTTPDTLESLKSLSLSKIVLDLIIYPEYNIYMLEGLIDHLEDRFSLICSFNVFSEKDVAYVEDLVCKLKISQYNIIPCYNGKNLDFFEECIYVNEQDILDSHQTKQNIFAHQVLNTNDFGKLTITSSGKVYANLHHEPLGTIDDDIRYLVYKEMSNGISWRRIRDMKPCSDCIYQWLCPSPSDYELKIGKPNLCYINNS